MTSDTLINYANIVIGPTGAIVLAVPESNLDTDLGIEVQLRLDMSLDLFQGLNHIGHIQATPPTAMQALATTGQITLIEVGESGPVRIHRSVQVRASV